MEHANKYYKKIHTYTHNMYIYTYIHIHIVCRHVLTHTHTHTHTHVTVYMQLQNGTGNLNVNKTVMPSSLRHRHFHDCVTWSFIFDKCNGGMLAAGSFRIVCGLHVQRCTYL